jgi:hypothetical protein
MFIELKSPIESKDLIQFLEANHNIMIFADAEAKRPVRQLVNEFGVEFEAPVSINQSSGIPERLINLFSSFRAVRSEIILAAILERI